MLAGCAFHAPRPVRPSLSPSEAQAAIENLLPPVLSDRVGWTDDIYASLSAQNVEFSNENICAVVAVIGQESGFQVNPVVPGLPAIAWREIDRRATGVDLPTVFVHGALNLMSSKGRTFSQRIDAARTEQDLSDIYEDIIGEVPLGRQLFADHNPVRTRGPMQVSVAFAKEYARSRNVPEAFKRNLPDELFTRRGGIYFGVAHLFAYSPPYNAFLYRFADYNAGQYASRNAAFQAALSRVSGVPLTPDGALLAHEPTARQAGGTEAAARAMAPRLSLSDGDIHDALELGKTKEFEQSALYRRVFELADRQAVRPVARAVLPQIELHGPKITRRLTTAWYARRVDSRFKKCLHR
jgi:hypothetical protein